MQPSKGLHNQVVKIVVPYVYILFITKIYNVKPWSVAVFTHVKLFFKSLYYGYEQTCLIYFLTFWINVSEMRNFQVCIVYGDSGHVKFCAMVRIYLIWSRHFSASCATFLLFFFLQVCRICWTATKCRDIPKVRKNYFQK